MYIQCDITNAIRIGLFQVASMFAHRIKHLILTPYPTPDLFIKVTEIKLRYMAVG